ncbi:hypothetical protein L1987_70206 [Smallanthus sonchifolius]|uniref:Uncharacterized protein n=1 Tax=Smallanthus sonchifolius TaxID=185202 RepID=A0ACB9AN92_9ASTR|nr:hypothetical protein L1987_70206 [Smallanthus sonchifolius]
MVTWRLEVDVVVRSRFHDKEDEMVVEGKNNTDLRIGSGGDVDGGGWIWWQRRSFIGRNIVMDLNSTNYYNLVSKLGNEAYNVSKIKSSLEDYVDVIYKRDVENRYGEPMIVIGMYIALASLICIVEMAVDLFHGVRSKKLWFPCRIFSIDALSVTVIAVTMKLPVDLSGNMPGVVDQVAKLGSMAFMCTMMANLLPCLATMDNKTLLANVVALGVLVVTLVVNVSVQIHTGVVESHKEYYRKIDEMVPTGKYPRLSRVLNTVTYSQLAIVYMAMLSVLMIIYVCSSLAILKSKHIIEQKYQERHETSSENIQQPISPVEKLQQHVSNYWIMAGSGNPQFIIACSPTTTAAGVICAFTTSLHTITIGFTIDNIGDYGSNYGFSMLVILIVQFIGVVLGTVAPLYRCFASLSFKVSPESILKQIKVFKVESYWTQKLSEWKRDSIRFPFRIHKRNVVLKNLKSLIFLLFIGIQWGIVVICKIIALIPFFIMICVFSCFWLLQAVFCSSKESSENLEHSPYVLLLENETELAERTLKRLTKSIIKLIKKGEKKQPNNLMNLIKEKPAIGFQGDPPDSWSLAVVNLTTIAVTLRKIKKVEVYNLLKSVREGLEYVTLVEKNLPMIKKVEDDSFLKSVREGLEDVTLVEKSVQAAETLWEEVDFRHKWLGIKLKYITSKVNVVDCEDDVTMHIVKLFLKEAEKIKQEVEKIKKEEGSLNDDFKFKSICANSMYRITEAIIHDDKESHKKSFDEVISSRIAEIIAECLTNLPQVIAMKCHTDVIEKREASVKAAARLLGETKEIIKILQDPSRHVPSTNPDDMLL